MRSHLKQLHNDINNGGRAIISVYAIPGIPKHPHKRIALISDIQTQELVLNAERIVCELLHLKRPALRKVLYSKPEGPGKRRRGTTQDMANAMHIIALVLRIGTDLTWCKIGEILGNRDHSGMVGGAKTIKNLCDVYPKFKVKINTILFRLDLKQLPKKKWDLN
tara:strand:+ start:312 stop:803 length:492 start_codon:yes stop_codon:yes gene_type:complete